MEFHRIECSLPIHLSITESSLNGWGIFVNKFIRKDALIYENRFNTVRMKDFPSRMNLVIDDVSFLLDSYNHISPYLNNLHAVYTFDTLMNHHCEANTHDKADKVDPLKYYVFATRDIQKGEELTCNYNTFKWINDYPFPCICQSKNCCGSVEGFSKLDTTQKKRLAQWTNTSAQMMKGRIGINRYPNQL